MIGLRPMADTRSTSTEWESHGDYDQNSRRAMSVR